VRLGSEDQIERLLCAGVLSPVRLSLIFLYEHELQCTIYPAHIAVPSFVVSRLFYRAKPDKSSNCHERTRPILRHVPTGASGSSFRARTSTTRHFPLTRTLHHHGPTRSSTPQAAASHVHDLMQVITSRKTATTNSPAAHRRTSSDRRSYASPPNREIPFISSRSRLTPSPYTRNGTIVA
jgi:hypothetical protein